ncbi:nucleoside triphosphate hydrolase [Jannaschia pagri]|uniref:Nucleoside triphosphate hydrolase n=1 Tax=Jannaschia pagri TaxID=2829797 RepID=A0ABQ4NJ40_9RHOB|nr:MULTISPECIES: AAA family ATPase [unclassified Jannaschia]GIT90586.1 nucleoside triphosphate hydrolase [Jannaschia sp. AI_61]GIT94418.1 nucleoside triphosphate hydrolase [Jannaschia sp. AI_62]
MTRQALAARIRSLPGARVLVALAGPPASGKSTLAETLAAEIGGAVLPMDGFHLDNRILEARGLLARKGAPETFDTGGLARTLDALRSGGEVIHPVFDRSREIAIAGAGVIPAAIRVVIVEGNWLLLDRDPWRALQWDLTVRLDVPEEVLRQRLTERWSWMTPEARAEKIEGNDLPNARLVQTGSRPADVIL